MNNLPIKVEVPNASLINPDDYCQFLNELARVNKILTAAEKTVKVRIRELYDAGEQLPHGVFVEERLGRPEIASPRECWNWIRDNRLMTEDEFRERVKVPYSVRAEIIDRIVEQGKAPTKKSAGEVFDESVKITRSKPVKVVGFSRIMGVKK